MVMGQRKSLDDSLSLTERDVCPWRRRWSSEVSDETVVFAKFEML